MSLSSRSLGISSSIFVSRTLVPSGSSASLIGSFMDLEYAESFSNVMSLLMSILLNLGNYIK